MNLLHTEIVRLTGGFVVYAIQKLPYPTLVHPKKHLTATQGSLDLTAISIRRGKAFPTGLNRLTPFSAHPLLRGHPVTPRRQGSPYPFKITSYGYF